MAQRITLNEVQIAVLRWISEGCPDDGVDGVSARISAGALRNRGLVRTTGRGPTWRATITADGKDYLQQVDGPNPPAPRQPNVSVTGQLVDDVIAAGGSLRVPRKHWTEREGIDCERRAQLAETYGKVPRGRRLIVRTASAEELLIELVTDRTATADGEEEPSVGLSPIAVPARLTKYHRVAREFRDRTNLHEVSRKALPRALRIVHALAVEAERRGHEIACVRVHEDRYGRTEWKPAHDGQLVFAINGHQLKVRIWEKGAGQRGPYEYQMKRWKADREQPFRLMQFVDRPKPYDTGATGELNIEALGSAYGRQKTWGDRNSSGSWRTAYRTSCASWSWRPSKPRSVDSRESVSRPSSNVSGRLPWSVRNGGLSMITGSRFCAIVCMRGKKPKRSARTARQSKHAMASM